MRTALLSLALFLAIGCTPDRPQATAAELSRRFDGLCTTNAAVVDRVIQRMGAVLDEQRAAGNPLYIDILVLSGGADWGAFGAGFLHAWSARRARDNLAMPRFDVVTGISTGALIAPYAFLGSYDRVDELYRGSSDAWSRRNVVFGLLTGHGFYDITLLEQAIGSELESHIAPGVAERLRQPRSLLVATADLDLGMLRLWDLTAEALPAARIFAIQRAAIAVPAAFDPVILDDSLQADAGTLKQLFAEPQPRRLRPLLKQWNAAHPDNPARLRYWVVINNRIYEPPTTVQHTWHNTLSRSLAMLLKSGILAPLTSLWLQAQDLRQEGLDVQFRWVAIPPEFPIDETIPMFDQRITHTLSDLGRSLGGAADPWRQDLPAYTWRSHDLGEHGVAFEP